MNYSHFKSLILNIVHISKEKLPNSSIFIVFFLILKFNGIIVLINSYEHKFSLTLTTYNLFHALTFYGNLSRDNLNPVSYIYFCIPIYILILFPLLVYFFILIKYDLTTRKKYSQSKIKDMKYISYIPNTNNNIIDINFRDNNLTLLEKKLAEFSLWIILFICIFSQHLIEILAFCFCGYIQTNNKVNKEYAKITTSLHGKFVLTMINSIFIIIINIFLFFSYMFMNNKLVDERNNQCSHNHNKKCLLFLILIFNSQGIHYYSSLFHSQKFNIISVIICEVILFILIIFHIKSYRKPNIYISLYTLCILFAFYSGIISTIIQIGHKIAKLNINSSLFILKLLLNICITYVSYIFIKKYQHFKYDKLIVANLFVRNKNTSTTEYIYRLVEILDNIKKNTLQSIKLCSLIAKHNLTCANKQKCECYLIDNETILSHLKNSAICKSQFSYFFDSGKEFIDEFLLIMLFIENEISNLISSVYICGKIHKNLDILLLHCNFVFFYENNVIYALYLMENYLSKIKHLPFEYLLYFTELKKHILKLDNSKKKYPKNLFSPETKFNSFHAYFQDLEYIKVLLYTTCVHYQKLIRYKSIYTQLQSKNHSKKESTTNKNNLLDKIFNTCIIITNTTQSIKKELSTKYVNKTLKNPEVCYLLTAFFELTDKESIFQLNKYFSFIDTYEQLEIFDSSYIDVNFKHPLIFDVNNNVLLYVSEKLSERLLYSVTELKGNNVHILLPELFQEQHSLEMKTSLLIKQTHSIKKDVFLLDKDKYIRKTTLHGGPLPTFNNNIIIICDASIIDDNNSNDYLFILDPSMNVIAHTRDFEEKYRISNEMFFRLNFNFCSIFGINYDQIIKQYHSQIESIENRNLSEIKKLINTFYYCDLNSIVVAYSDKAEDIQAKEIKITRNKYVLIKFVDKIKNYIQEAKSDNDWKERISYLKDIVQNEININKNSFFQITISLHYLANAAYFQVKIHDKDKFNHLNFSVLNGGGTAIKISFLCSSPTNYRKKSIRPQSSNKNLHILQIKSDSNILNNVHSFSQFNEEHINYQKTSSTKLLNAHLESLTRNTSNQELTIDSSNQKLNITKAISSIDNSNFYSSSLQNNMHLNFASKENMDQQQEKFWLLFHIKCLTKIENILLNICYFLLGIITVLYVLSFLLKNDWIGQLKNFLHINIFIVQLKQYLLDISINSSQGCYMSDNITSEIFDDVYLKHNTLNFLIETGSTCFFQAYKDLQSFLSNYTNEPLIQKINDIIYSVDEYKILNNDFTVIKYNSTFDEQLYFYHYITSMLSNLNGFQICRVKDLFVYKNITQKSNKIASNSEQVLFYIANNIIIKFFDKTDMMISTAGNFINSRRNENSNKTKLYNMFIIMIGFIMCFGFLCLIVIYQNKITTHLKKFFTFHNENGMFEIRLELLRKMIFILNYETSQRYELTKRKKTIHQKQYAIIKNKLAINFNNRNSQSFQSKFLNPFQHKKNYKKVNTDKSLLHKRKDKDAINPQNKNSLTKTKNLKIFSIKDFSFSYFSLSIIKNSFIITIFCLVLHLSLQITILIGDETLFQKINLATHLSFFYSDKVPSHIEILLNHRFAILNNDIIITYVPFTQYQLYLPNYVLTSAEIETQITSDERYILMGQTQMTFLYFRLHQQNSIIQTTEAREDKPILPLRREFSTKLKKKQNVCEVVTEEYSKGGFKLFEGYNETYNVHACHKIAGGAADNGNTNSMANYMSYLEDEFLDFIRGYKINGNPPNALIKKLSSDIFSSIYFQFTFLYTPSWIVTINFVQKDIIELFKLLRNTQLICYIIQLLVNVFYLIVFFLMIMQLLRKKETYFGVIIGNLSTRID